MSTSRSLSSSRPWSGGDGDEYSSLIRYRVLPLDYKPAIKCKCGRKAARWISWSNDNPGRRYLKCAAARSGGCDFWEWYEDNLTTPFITQLLVDLRDAVRALKKENKDLGAMIAEARARVDAQIAMEGQLRTQVAAQDAQNVELVGRVKKLEKERAVFMFVILACIAMVAR